MRSPGCHLPARRVQKNEHRYVSYLYAVVKDERVSVRHPPSPLGRASAAERGARALLARAARGVKRRRRGAQLLEPFGESGLWAVDLGDD